MRVSLDLIYGHDAFEDDGGDALTVNCYHRYYDVNYRKDSCKGWAACPIQIVVRGRNVIDSAKRRFTNFPDECKYAQLDASLDVINGTELVSLTYDDLSDDAKENIDLGLSTLEDEIRAAGGTVYGNRVTELRFAGTRNAQGTAYEDEDMAPPRHDGADDVAVDEKKNDSSTAKADDEDFDLFGDL